MGPSLAPARRPDVASRIDARTQSMHQRGEQHGTKTPERMVRLRGARAVDRRGSRRGVSGAASDGGEAESIAEVVDGQGVRRVEAGAGTASEVTRDRSHRPGRRLRSQARARRGTAGPRSQRGRRPAETEGGRPAVGGSHDDRRTDRELRGPEQPGQLQSLRLPREPARSGRGRGAEPLCADGQPRLCGLRQAGQYAARTGGHRYAVERLPDRRLHRSVGRPDRGLRPARGPLDPEPVHHPWARYTTTASRSRRPATRPAPITATRS